METRSGVTGGLMYAATGEYVEADQSDRHIVRGVCELR
jgi:hypothetical protein